jgi:DNA-binding LytR/AlgR family response regulator
MNVLIAEDEALAAERIRALLQACEPDFTIVDQVDSVEDLAGFFNAGKSVDLLLLDIQLADGKSFEVFTKAKIETPIIFTTAYNQYALDAFKQFSVDYLLKPIQQEDLNKAISKFKKLTGVKSIAQTDWQKLQKLLNQRSHSYKERFIIKSGNKLQFKTTDEIAYFLAEGKEAYLVSKKESRKYIIENTLEELEQLLNPQQFFRISRKHIVNVASISEVKGRISTQLEIRLAQQMEQPLTVSRDRAHDFKRWLSQEQ